MKISYSLRRVLLLSVVLLSISCKESFDPTLNEDVQSFLVVEGFINTSGQSRIQLSRTVKTYEKLVQKFELKASLQVEDESSNIYRFTEEGAGAYTTAALSLPVGRAYRLRIRTADGKEYLSRFETSKSTPATDVKWARTPEGVMITADAFDPAGKTTYYQWNFAETWHAMSEKFSAFAIVRSAAGISVQEREKYPETFPEAVLMHNCWPTVYSGNIITSSTASLSEDRIVGKEMVFIPNGSEKLSIRYSIFINQFAISKEAFEFFELMKKNSETMGTVFDPQPTQIRGNITCVTQPGEIVVGYISASSVISKRVFIDRSEVPDWKYAPVCGEKYVQLQAPLIRRDLADEGLLLGGGEYDDVGRAIGVYAYPKECIDCRLRGGGGSKPSYW